MTWLMRCEVPSIHRRCSREASTVYKQSLMSSTDYIAPECYPDHDRQVFMPKPTNELVKLFGEASKFDSYLDVCILSTGCTLCTAPHSLHCSPYHTAACTTLHTAPQRMHTTHALTLRTTQHTVPRCTALHSAMHCTILNIDMDIE